MYERLRIHHAVGSRVLLDSGRDPIRFAYEKEATGFVFSVFTDRTPAVEEILHLKDEINVFIFKESQGTALEKVWFYTGNGSVGYHEDEKILSLTASTCIVYRPGDYEL